MTNSTDKIVTVIGGSGFIGRYVTRSLAKAGYRVRVATRRPDLAGHLQTNGNVGQVFPVQVNIRYPSSIDAAIKGADYVINLAGILDPSGKQKFGVVNAVGAKIVAEMATKHRVKKLVHFSTLNVAAKQNADDKYSYLSSNFDGEENAAAAFADAIIVRPSLVFGAEDRLFNRHAHFAKLNRKFVPVFSDLDKSFEPVFVNDVAKAVVAMLEGDHAGKTFELGGPRKMTMGEIVQTTLNAIDRDIKMVRLPRFLSNIIASICTLLPYSWVTKGELKLWSADQLVTEEAKQAGLTLAGLGIEATDCEEAMLPYLQHFRPMGDYGLHELKQE
ncbi:MAG: complex I NDUFA9 subunit family protein [Rhizobiales bacterium]|nr:complex I NDUFA9 subunit family protein [Hyphomicrobiales bacterium]NRB14246.1 complex I NDUFA9 subunit family protein [Hyphomicrobiales bacterium]